MLVSPWSRYDGSLCEVTELHPINNVAWAKGVWFSDMFKYVLLNIKLVLQISLNYDNNKSALVQVMACSLLGIKPLSQPVMIDFNWCM